jgi:hypothetical protein
LKIVKMSAEKEEKKVEAAVKKEAEEALYVWLAAG